MQIILLYLSIGVVIAIAFNIDQQQSSLPPLDISELFVIVITWPMWLRFTL
jgi:hypothetical protein